MGFGNIYRTVEKYFNVTSGILLSICIAFIFCWSIPPVKEFLKTHILPQGTDDTAVLVYYMTLIVTLLMIIIKTFTKNSSEIIDRIEKSSLITDTNLFYNGTVAIYEDATFEVNRKRPKNKKISIDILGFTLFSAAHQFEKWKSKNQLMNININLHYLSEEFIISSSYLDDTWVDQLHYSLKTIDKFLANNQKYLADNNVTIKFYPYKHLPAVHGFRVSDGTYYIAFAQWNEQYQILQPTSSIYIKVGIKDNSEHATELRVLFDNWIFAARNPAYRTKKSGTN